MLCAARRVQLHVIKQNNKTMSDRSKHFLVKKFRHDQQGEAPPEPLSDCDPYDFEPDDLDELHCSAPHPFSTSDELPIFRIQSLSPTSRSLSPIDHISASMLNITISPCSSSFTDEIEPIIVEDQISPCSSSGDMNSPDDRFDAFVSLEEIHSQIGTPTAPAVHSKLLKLETIVEGVFLDTPPKEFSNFSFYRDSLKAIQLFNTDKYVQEHKEHRLKRKNQEIVNKASGDKMELDEDDPNVVDTHNLAKIIEYSEF